MPRKRKPPRLYLRKFRAGKYPAQWVIRDGAKETGTGAGPDDTAGAAAALERYLAERHSPPKGANRLDQLLIDEVVRFYLKDHAKHSPSRQWIVHTATPVTEWWTGKYLDEVTTENCRAYLKWRTAQISKRSRVEKPISAQTARHELKTLRTAINYYHAARPLLSVPKVTLPPAAPQRIDYWLTRPEVAARALAAWRDPYSRHVARVILIGVYSGTRPGAILGLRWLPSATSGWFDLERGVLHRRGLQARRSRKHAPPARIHERLLPHLKRWAEQDRKLGITNVIHFRGKPVGKLRRSWATVRKSANHANHDGPHILRHTAATWQMQGGTSIADAAAFLGMTPETLWEVYGHHHPDFQDKAARASSKREPLQKPPRNA